MKSLSLFVLIIASAISLRAQTPDTSKATPPPSSAQEKLSSNVFEWDKLAVTPTKTGDRRAVFDGPTTTVDKLHCHISTLKPGESSGAPRLHLQEEVIIVKEGTIEAHFDGQTRLAPAGSVIFFAARATTSLRNPGTVPATYTVIYYHTPLTPKS